MFLKHKIIRFAILLLLLCILGCNSGRSTSSAANRTWDTSSGSVEQIDDYPLYTISYKPDYKFDQYLQTGVIPIAGGNSFNNNNYACTCFFTGGDNHKIFGRNYDWPELTSYFIVYTNPADGFASISTVDLGFFDYDHNKAPDDGGNQQVLRTLPYHPFDGMNEMGVAIGMNAVPEARSP